MTDPTIQDLLQAGIFDVLGDLFPDRDSADELLGTLGISWARVRTFDGTRPAHFWRLFADDIAKGTWAGVTVPRLVEAAAKLRAGNARLSNAAGNTGALRVLLFAASPADEAGLRLDVEAREIGDAVKGSRRPIELIHSPATRSTDIVRRMVDADPQIVHFSGHGSATGALLFEAADGVARPVPTDVLAQALGRLGHLHAVLLNSCFSGGYATPLLSCSDYVIGSLSPIYDPAATILARSFYATLGAGRTVPQAYQAALADLEVARWATTDLRLLTSPEQAARGMS